MGKDSLTRLSYPPNRTRTRRALNIFTPDIYHTSVFDKSFLVGKVVNSLEKAGYEVLRTEGNFDVVAKRDRQTLLIKVLMNVDALKEDQAMSLRAVAYFMGCQPVVVSTKNNRETLDDGVVYSRFDVPVMNPKLLDALTVQEEMSAIDSSKGRHTVEINADRLRDRRRELGFTLETLADRIGVSKKAVYEIESRRVNPTKATADKLERILATRIQRPYEMKGAPETHLKPRSGMQENVSRELTRMGMDNTSVYSSGFENVGREKFSIIASVSNNIEKVRRQATVIRRLSGFLSSKAVMVTKRSHEESLHGVPVVLEAELSAIESPRDLKKIIEEKE